MNIEWYVSQGLGIGYGYSAFKYHGIWYSWEGTASGLVIYKCIVQDGQMIQHNRLRAYVRDMVPVTEHDKERKPIIQMIERFVAANPTLLFDPLWDGMVASYKNYSELTRLIT